MQPILRPYDSDHDEPAALRLWAECLGDRWPIGAEVFRFLMADGSHLIASVGGEVVGLVAMQQAGDRGSVLAVLVAAAHRRGGIGRRLLAAAQDHLRAQGASTVQLGGGAGRYFWCGVPADPPGAWDFLEACGWIQDGYGYDLVGDLAACVTPPWVWERVRSVGVTIRRALPTDLEPALRFEYEHFPGWAPDYEAMVRRGEGADMVVAVDAHGRVVGTSGILSPRQAWWRSRFPWARLLGSGTGGVDALGVAEDQRGRGIGLGLAAFVTEQLKAEGLAKSYVGWTWLIDWYGRLGYSVWQEYRMSRRTL